MPPVPTIRRALAVALTFLVATPFLAQDPWAKVPPHPTSCYDKEDFTAQLSNLRHEVVVLGDRQRDINTAIDEKLNEMSPEAKQAKMMAFMTKDPMAAGKQMQELATAGEQQQGAMMALNQKRQALDEQWKAAQQAFERESAPLGPIYQKAQVQMEPGGNSALGRQLFAQHNAEYEKLCAKWFTGERSPFLAYLGALRQFLEKELIPAEEERTQVSRLQFRIYGVDMANYKSTARHAAATEYMDAMSRVFGKRRAAPAGQ